MPETIAKMSCVGPIGPGSGGEKLAERGGVAARLDFRIEPIRVAVVVDQNDIKASTAEIGDCCRERLATVDARS